jgi:hypothetical protein
MTESQSKQSTYRMPNERAAKDLEIRKEINLLVRVPFQLLQRQVFCYRVQKNTECHPVAELLEPGYLKRARRVNPVVSFDLMKGSRFCVRPGTRREERVPAFSAHHWSSSVRDKLSPDICYNFDSFDSKRERDSGSGKGFGVEQWFDLRLPSRFRQLELADGISQTLLRLLASKLLGSF